MVSFALYITTLQNGKISKTNTSIVVVLLFYFQNISLIASEERLHLEFHDLNEFRGNLGTPYAILYLICSICIIILGYFVHRSIYKLLKRLKKRALNKIVYPSMVVNSISIPSILLFMSLRNICYPMESVIGQNGCYIFISINFWRWQFYQFHSFFIALFRYIILYHSNFLATFKIDPNVSFT